MNEPEGQTQGRSPEDRKPPPPNRRRDKPQLSCNLCRKRKLKCDRRHPCNRCLSRGIASTCTYPTAKPFNSRPSPESPVPPDSLQRRLEDLEDQIVSLIDAPTVRDDRPTPALSTVRSPTAPRRPSQPLPESHSTAGPGVTALETPALTPESLPSGGRPSLGQGSLTSSSSGSVYVDASHWTAILNNISDLKDRVQRQDGATPASKNYAPEPGPGRGPQLLFGNHGNPTRESILAALPERTVVDRMMYEFFSDVGPLSMACLHIKTFQKQYDQFWDNPNETSFLWIALLFSIMCLANMFRAAQQSSQSGDEAGVIQTFRHPKYLNEVVHCLILGDYPSGGPHAIEALLHYLFIENFRRLDSEIGLWVLMGAIIRIAFRMGYHRDPSQLQGITPFQAELRRRTWASLYHADTVFSIQAGVPRMINDYQCDTQPPANLLEDDFDEDTTHMPASRSPTEATPVQYIIIRYKIAKVLGFIVDLGNTLDPKPEEVKTAENALRDAYDPIPARFKVGTQLVSFSDTPYQILCRLVLGVLYEKCKILLYRRCMNRPDLFDEPSDSAQARNVLIEAALKILEYQDTLHRESKPDGMLSSFRWKFSSVLFYDFHMAVAVLTTLLYRGMRHCPQTELPTPTRSKIITALRLSHQIWMNISYRSRDAMQSIEMLEGLFAKLESGMTAPYPMENDWELPLGNDFTYSLDGSNFLYSF